MMLPPCSLQAEEEALYHMIVHSDKVLANALEPDDFVEHIYRTIFIAEKGLINKNGSGDFLSLCDALKNDQSIQALGGSPYLAELISRTSIPSPASTVVRILKEKRVLREATKMKEKIDTLKADEISQCFIDTGKMYAEMMISEKESSKQEMIDEILSKDEYIPCGFPKMDEMIGGGLYGGMLLLVAARPAVGKSTLATSIAGNLLGSGEEFLFLGMEMSRKHVLLRMLAHMYGERPSNIAEKAEKMINGIETPFTILQAESSIEQIQMRILQTEAKVVIVDYLGLITMQGNDNRFLKIEEISRRLKLAAMESNKALVVLTQLNREMERDKKKRAPVLADLWGGAEKDADVITALYDKDALEAIKETEVDFGSLPEKTDRTIGWKILKNRNGPMGEVDLSFRPEFFSMTEASF